MKSYYEANMRLLQKYHPATHRQFVDDAVAPVGEIISAVNGEPNLRVKNGKGETLFIHNISAPQEETTQFLERVPEKAKGLVVLLGMGLGYSPLALLRERKTMQHLAVFELDPGIFLQALQTTDLREVLADCRVILFVGEEPQVPEVLKAAQRSIQLEDTIILHHFPSFKHRGTAYEKLRDEVFSFVNKVNLSGATTNRFGQDFLANRFKQLTSIEQHCLLESLKDRFAGVPAFIVAGGPSLDKNIHLLPEVKGRALLIAVDTVLPALLRQGVEPDFVTSIDPQELTFEKFAAVIPSVRDVSLICSAAVAPKVPKVFPAARVFWIFAAKPMERWLNTLLGGTILTGGAGTVAHLNLLSAVILGCSPIVFVGQDLAFSSSHSHARHTFLTDQKMAREAMQGEQNSLWVDGVNGGKVRTNRAFFGDKEYFERIISENPSHYINATEGGAHILGTEVMALSEVIARYCQELPPQWLTDTIRHPSPIGFQKLLHSLKHAQELSRTLEDLVAKADKATATVRERLQLLVKKKKAPHSWNDLPQEVRTLIGEIDTTHIQLDQHKGFWDVLNEITMKGLKESTRMQRDIDILAGTSGSFFPWLRKSLDRREYINGVRKEVLGIFQKNLSDIVTYLQSEEELRSALVAQPDSEEVQLKLARLFYDADNLMLAKPILEKVLQHNRGSVEALFSLGAIAFQQNDLNAAGEYFERGKALDPATENKIQALAREFGDRFQEYAKNYTDIDPDTTKRLLLKGLRFCPDHPGIAKDLGNLAESLLSMVIAHGGQPSESVSSSLAEWCDDLDNYPSLVALLPRNLPGELYFQHGRVLAQTKGMEAAVLVYQKASRFLPDEPGIHLALADAFLSQDNYANGVRHLNQAVALDRSYAGYWENLGDNLGRAERYEDAIAAYEQCFISQPENSYLLKKIGDAYLALGQAEAARVAYEHYSSLQSPQPA